MSPSLICSLFPIKDIARWQSALRIDLSLTPIAAVRNEDSERVDDDDASSISGASNISSAFSPEPLHRGGLRAPLIPTRLSLSPLTPQLINSSTYNTPDSVATTSSLQADTYVQLSPSPGVTTPQRLAPMLQMMLTDVFADCPPVSVSLKRGMLVTDYQVERDADDTIEQDDAGDDEMLHNKMQLSVVYAERLANALTSVLPSGKVSRGGDQGRLVRVNADSFMTANRDGLLLQKLHQKLTT